MSSNDLVRGISSGIHKLANYNQTITDQQQTNLQNTASDSFASSSNNISRKFIFTTDNSKNVYVDEINCRINLFNKKEKLTDDNDGITIVGELFHSCVADFYISHVNSYALDLGFKDAYLLEVAIVSKQLTAKIVIKQKDYENKAIVKVLRQYNLAGLLHCSDAEANHILYQYISNMMYNTSILIPFRTGFYLSNNKYAFMIENTIILEKSIAISGKSFSRQSVNPREEIQKFVGSLISSSDRLTLVLTIHYTAMLSSILKAYNLNFNKIVVSNSDYDTTRAYLDVYGNMQQNTLMSSGETEAKLKKNVFYTRDDILYIGENSQELKPDMRAIERTRTNINFLIGTFCKGQHFDVDDRILNVSSDCLCVMIKGYATDKLPNEYIFPLDLSEFNFDIHQIRALIHDMDILFVNYVNEKTESIRNICMKYSAMNVNSYETTLACVFEILSNFWNTLAEFSITAYGFNNYVSSVANFNNDNSVLLQTRETISNLVINEEIEIVHADKLFATKVRTNAPIVYYKNNMLYFESALFNEKVADVIGGVTSCLGLKKLLLNEGLLDCDNDNEYYTRIRLPGTDTQKRYVTVSLKLLNEKALEKVPPEFSTFLPCKNDDGVKRIRLGYDTSNRGVYWSIHHPDMINQTMLVTGSPNCGKSSFVFKLSKSAAEIGECMVYIDYNNSCTEDEFQKFGVDEDWIKNNIRYVDYMKWNDNKELLLNNSHTDNGRKIIVIKVSENGKLLSGNEKAENTDDILQSILDWCMNNKDNSRVHVIIDEINNANLGKDSVIGMIITQCRKFGISLIMISPDMSNLNRDALRTLESASTKAVFRQDNTSTRRLLVNNCGYNSKTAFEKYLGTLDKFVCCLSGNLEDYNGNMKKETIQIHIDTASMSS